MKTLLVMLVVVLAHGFALAGDVTVRKVQGDVKVRHWVTEAWTTVRSGEVLGVGATMSTGSGGSSVVAVLKNGVATTITIPPGVMVDMSDIRDLTPEELMLKLTMQRVRSSSYEWKNNELNIPNTTVVHGSDASSVATLAENDPAEGIMLMNGTRLLFEHGFYSTCALKTLEVMRRFPDLATSFEYRWLVAEALERTGLGGEALNEYAGIASLAGLTDAQKASVKSKLAQLRKGAE